MTPLLFLVLCSLLFLTLITFMFKAVLWYDDAFQEHRVKTNPKRLSVHVLVYRGVKLRLVEGMLTCMKKLLNLQKKNISK